MVLSVRAARNALGVPIPFELTATLDPFDFGGDRYEVVAPVDIQGETVATTEERIVLRATLTTSVEGHCARCLEPVRFDVHATMHETFDPHPPVDEPDWFAYHGTQLELTDAVMGAVVQALPLRLLCAEDCPGFNRFVNDAEEV